MDFVEGVCWIGDTSALNYPRSAGTYKDVYNRDVEISQEHIDRYVKLSQDGGTPLLWGKLRQDGIYQITDVVAVPESVNLRDYI